MTRSSAFLALATSVLLAAPSLQAQRGNASDVGPRPRRTVVNLGGGDVGAGVATAASRVQVLSLASVTKYSGTQAAQLAVDVSGSAPSQELSQALLAADGAPSLERTNAFIAQYVGMLSGPSPRRIAATAAAFNAMVDGASTAYLAHPPAEFVAAQAVLRELVEKTSGR